MLEDGPEGGAANDGTTVLIAADEPAHARLPVPDDELVASALRLRQAVAPVEVVVVSRDIGVRTRSRAWGLPARRLPDKYLIEGGEFHQAALDRAASGLVPGGGAEPESGPSASVDGPTVRSHERAQGQVCLYGRDEAEWVRLTEWGRQFLIELATLGSPIAYADLNAALVRDTSLKGFDFKRPDDRAALGYLLQRIVRLDQELLPPAAPDPGALMLSALVGYRGAKDPGPGFYELAKNDGLLPQNASKHEKEKFWFDQLKGLVRRPLPGRGA